MAKQSKQSKRDEITKAEKDRILARLKKLENSVLRQREQVAKLKALYLYSDEISDEEKRKALSMLNWLSDEPPSKPLSEEEKNKLLSEVKADFLKETGMKSFDIGGGFTEAGSFKIIEEED